MCLYVCVLEMYDAAVDHVAHNMYGWCIITGSVVALIALNINKN